MLALLCGGQGTLSDRIFASVADQPAAAAIFSAAGACLGRDPRELIRTSSADALSVNRVSQILTVTSSLAIHACIADLLNEPTAVTGYSVGEMAAWSVAGIWSAAEALQLTAVRAQLMDGVAGPDGRLGYVRGLDRTALEHLLARHRCEIAIGNPDLLFVIGGSERDVTDLCQEAASQGAARAGLLAVKIASHTSRLEQACQPLQRAFAASAYAPIAGEWILLAGDGGARIFSVSDAMAKLACQVARPIDWAATLEALAELGVDRVLDLGPGHALAEMMQGVRPSIRCYAADGFRTIDGLRNWIASGQGAR